MLMNEKKYKDISELFLIFHLYLRFHKSLLFFLLFGDGNNFISISFYQ